MTIRDLMNDTKDSFQLKINRWERAVEDMPLLWEQLAREGVEIRFNASDGCMDVNLSGNKDNFRRIWGLLRNAGWKPEMRPGSEDRAKFATFWHHPHEDHYPRVWLYFTSTTCKIKQVGVKMVEQAVYEVICGDAEQTDLGELLSSENDNPLAREG